MKAVAKKRGRPPKKLRDVDNAQERAERLKRALADYGLTRKGEIYRSWHGCRQNMGATKGEADRIMSCKWHLSERQIQNIRSEGDGLMRELAARTAAANKEREGRLTPYNLVREMRATLAKGMAVLRTVGYSDLLEGCPMAGKLPAALASFTSEKARVDSLEYFTAQLAAAFLRAHEARIAAERGAEKIEKELKPLRQKFVANELTRGAYSGSTKQK